MKGKKISKEQISVLVGTNATGTHRLKLTMVGKSKRPLAMRNINIETDLPSKYYNTKYAWFTAAIFSDWFFNHFVPAVIKFQVEVLGLPRDEVRTVQLLDNAPAHPNADTLVTHNGQIHVMYLPPNTTSQIQPIGSGYN